MRRYGYSIKIVHSCGHTNQIYRPGDVVNDPNVKEWVEREEKKTCGQLKCEE